MKLVPENINEAIKHLAPKSQEEINTANKKTTAEYTSRKNEIKKAMEGFAKEYDTTVKYTEMRVLVDEPLSGKDFSADIQLTPRFSFWIRTQNYTDQFEVGWSLKDGNVGRMITNDLFDWEEFSYIDEVKDKIYSWIKDYSDYKKT